MVRLIILVFGILTLVGCTTVVGPHDSNGSVTDENVQVSEPSISSSPKTVSAPPVPQSKILQSDYHIFQTFNNCGPASLSMALRYYGIDKSQKELGDVLRPYQVVNGDNDDKSVTLAELAEEAKKLGLVAYNRPGGTVEMLEELVALDLPVITRTWLKVNDDIGHYRVVKGYDRGRGVLIQDDSLQGKNLEYGYADFEAIWKKFGYEFLVLVSSERSKDVEEILGELVDEKVAWQKVVDLYEEELQENQNDLDARFQLSVALFYKGDFQRSVDEFEKVESRLSFRALWYQIEPIQAYMALGDYERVFVLTDKILNNQNSAFSELYYMRGKIYQEQGQNELARAEFEKAVHYNRNFELARQALRSL